MRNGGRGQVQVGRSPAIQQLSGGSSFDPDFGNIGDEQLLESQEVGTEDWVELGMSSFIVIKFLDSGSNSHLLSTGLQ